jgi:hypothetical protein
MRISGVLVELMLAWFVLVIESRSTPHMTTPQRHKVERQIKQRKDNCETFSCKQYQNVKDEGMNCVNACVSQSCYDEIYAMEPLEDGEIDTFRAAKYVKCTHSELQVETNKRVAEERAKKIQAHSLNNEKD